jgi:hypothetical protein
MEAPEFCSSDSRDKRNTHWTFYGLTGSDNAGRIPQVMQSERYQIEMLVGYHWLTCCCCFDEQCILFCDSEMVEVVCAGRFQRSALYSGMDSNISHSNECIIHFMILCDTSTLIVPLFTLQSYIQFFHKRLLFQFECRACQPIIAS